MARRSTAIRMPLRRHQLTIPPDSPRAWVRLALWESSMGLLVAGAVVFGTRLIATAHEHVVTVYNFTNCYAAPVVLPCERVAFQAGHMNMMFTIWCGLLMFAVAAWLLSELWWWTTPSPITDDFLKLLDDSFGYDWRSLRTWPWARLGWAYGFTLAGGLLAVGIGLLVASSISSRVAKAPATHVETSQSFRKGF